MGQGMTEMKTYTDGLAGARRRSRARARLLDKGKKLKPTRSITFESPAEMVRMLLDARRKVVSDEHGAPFVIHSEEQLVEYTAELERLTSIESPSASEIDAINLLSFLIEKYEDEH